MIDLLRSSIDEAHARMRAIEDRAAGEGRDTLTEAEQSAWNELRAEMAAKTDRLSEMVGRQELDAQAAILVSRVGLPAGGDPARMGGKPAFPYRTPGEYVLAYMRSKRGDATEGARFTRALADVTTAQTPGLVPPQVTGDILGAWLANRPSVDAMSKPPLPPVGMEVQRPRITQHAAVGPHVEKAAVASQAFTLDLLKIPLSSYAGGVDVSWELASRSSPGALDVIFQDLVRVYAKKSDADAWAAVEADITQSVAWDGTAGTLAQVIAQAATMIAANSAESVFPDTAWLGVTSWGVLAGLTDSTGRPLFSDLAPANALGSADLTGSVGSVMGLRAVVDPYIPANTFVLGASEEVEFYETPGAPVQLSVVDVGVAGYNVGAIGMWAAKAVDPLAFAGLTYTPPPPLAADASKATGATKKAS